jgi:hypothetical protein
VQITVLAPVLTKTDHPGARKTAHNGWLRQGGMAALFIDGKKVGEGKVDATAASVFSADDGCDVGCDTGAPVAPDYGPRGNEFNGVIKGVQLAIAEAADSADHRVSPDEARLDLRLHGAGQPQTAFPYRWRQS